jgi:hypothetical protein
MASPCHAIVSQRKGSLQRCALLPLAPDVALHYHLMCDKLMPIWLASCQHSMAQHHSMAMHGFAMLQFVQIAGEQQRCALLPSTAICNEIIPI